MKNAYTVADTIENNRVERERRKQGRGRGRGELCDSPRIKSDKQYLPLRSYFLIHKVWKIKS